MHAKERGNEKIEGSKETTRTSLQELEALLISPLHFQENAYQIRQSQLDLLLPLDFYLEEKNELGDPIQFQSILSWVGN